MVNNEILRFEDVSFSWESSAGLINVYLTVNAGDFVLIQGKSGSGKSTLLRITARLEEPSKGMIFFDDKPYESYKPNALRQRVTLIQQTPTFIDDTVYDNILLPFSFEINKGRKKPSRNDVIAKLHELELDDVIDKNANELSVGQKQRVSILRTLFLEPDILLMDEPTSALDIESRKIVEKLTERLNKSGKTIMMVNHTDYKPKFNHRLIKVNKGVVTE